MKIPNNPISNLTRSISAACAIIAIVSLWTGHFVIAGIFMTASAVNLIVGSILKKY